MDAEREMARLSALPREELERGRRVMAEARLRVAALHPLTPYEQAAEVTGEEALQLAGDGVRGLRWAEDLDAALSVAAARWIVALDRVRRPERRQRQAARVVEDAAKRAAIIARAMAELDAAEREGRGIPGDAGGAQEGA